MIENVKIICFLLLIKINVSISETNNVCRHYQDYRNMTTNKNCWYNPDADSSPDVIAERYGFIFETHPIRTDDGYFLNIFRIRSKSHNNPSPVLLHHGIMASGICFMLSGKQSIAFYLAENGYDVWLANHRGNPYSSGHETFNMTEAQYWNFSFHEIALYDLPAVIEYIANSTGNQSRINYIGHSMGTTVALIYSSLRKEHAERYVNSLYLLAPVASLKHYFSPLRAYIPPMQQFVKSLESRNYNVLFPYPKRQKQALKSLCSQFPTIDICLSALYLFFGFEDGELMPADIPVLVAHLPARTALKVFQHYLQIVSRGRFQYYDYGPLKNMMKYQQQSPPLYTIEQIELPTHLFYGRNDYLAGEKDAQLIYNHLKMKQKSINLVPGNSKIRFNHIDFLSGKHAKKYLYKALIEKMKKT